MPTYRIKTPIELIQTLQSNKMLRDSHSLGSKEWLYYDNLFSKNIEAVSALFNKENEVPELKKYAAKN